MKFTLRSVLDPYVDIDLGPEVVLFGYDAAHAALKALEALGLALVSEREKLKTVTEPVEVLPSGMMRETEAAKYIGVTLNSLRHLRRKSKNDFRGPDRRMVCPRHYKRKGAGAWYKQSELDAWMNAGACDRPVPEWQKKVFLKNQARIVEYARKRKERVAAEKALAEIAAE